jgi:RimJ/RimL family protein N-acetyltransferase
MKVEYRPATADDLELLMAWRSHPELYRRFYLQDEALEWEEHANWWASREHRRDWIITINTDGRWRDVGNVNLSELDSDAPEVGVFVGEITAWGNGIATDAVEFAVDWLREHEYAAAKARILDDNDGSKRVFESVGFRRTGEARDNESEYRLSL